MARIPLTTPIPTPRTQFTVDYVSLNLQIGTVSYLVSRLDAAGNVIDTFTFSDTFAAAGIPPGEATSLENVIVARLKQRGTVN